MLNFSVKGDNRMRYRYNKLRGRIIEKYGNLSNFAKVIKLSNNSLSKKMNGKTGFSQEDIKQWSLLLETNPSQYGEYFFE